MRGIIRPGRISGRWAGGRGGEVLHLRRIIRPGWVHPGRAKGGTLHGGTLHMRRIIRPGRVSSRGDTSFEGNHKTLQVSSRGGHFSFEDNRKTLQGFIQVGGGGGGWGALHLRRIIRPGRGGHFIF